MDIIELAQRIEVRNHAIAEAKQMANTSISDGHWRHAEAVSAQTAAASEAYRATLPSDAQKTYDREITNAALNRWAKGEF